MNESDAGTVAAAAAAAAVSAAGVAVAVLQLLLLLLMLWGAGPGQRHSVCVQFVHNCIYGLLFALTNVVVRLVQNNE